MSNYINQKTKKIWRSILYTGLGTFALFCYENALADSSGGIVYNPNSIQVIATVNLNGLPKGWSAYKVSSNGSQAKIRGSQWTSQYNLPVRASSDDNLVIGTSKKIWVVFVYDQNGQRQGSFKYGAELTSDNFSAPCKVGTAPVYGNDGAVSFAGLNVNKSALATWKNFNGCLGGYYYHGYATVNINYTFVIK